MGQWLIDNYSDVPIGTLPKMVALSSKVGEYWAPFAGLEVSQGSEYITPKK